MNPIRPDLYFACVIALDSIRGMAGSFIALDYILAEISGGQISF
ncbi:MAG: hypothetical protein AB9861_20950 [Methanosarcina sp.]